MRIPHYSVKRTFFFSAPLVPELYKIHPIMQMLACPFMQDFPPHLIQQLDITIYSTGTHSTSLFLPTNSKGGLVVLNSTSTDCHTHWKYTRSLWNTDASVFRTHSGSTYGTHIGGDPLYLIWYILVYIFTGHTLSFLVYRYSTQLQEYQICTYLMCVLLLQHKEKASALSTASYWKSKLLEYQPGWKNLWHTVANLQQVCSM